MVSIAVTSVVAACVGNTIQRGYPCDDEIQLVLVTESGLPPGYSLVRLGGIERVCDAEGRVRAKTRAASALTRSPFQGQSDQCIWSRVVVRHHQGVKFAKQVQVIFSRDTSDVVIKLLVEKDHWSLQTSNAREPKRSGNLLARGMKGCGLCLWMEVPRKTAESFPLQIQRHLVVVPELLPLPQRIQGPDVCFNMSDTGILGKRKSEFSQQDSNL